MIILSFIIALLLTTLFLPVLLPILAVNIYSKAETVRIIGVFRNRPNAIIMGIK